MIDQHDLLVFRRAVMSARQIRDVLVGGGRLCFGLKPQGCLLPCLCIHDDLGAVFSREHECGRLVQPWNRKGIEPLGAFKGHVVDDDGPRRIAISRDLVEPLRQLPPNIKGKALRGLDEFEGRRQRVSVGRVLVIIEGVIDQIVFAKRRRWVRPGGYDNDLTFDVLRRIDVIVVDQVGGDTLRSG